MLTASTRKTDYALRQSLQLNSSQAHKTLKRLCKHFQHKVEVRWSQDHGLILFEEGLCALSASTTKLVMRCEANNRDDLRAITDTLDRHITAFCRDENFDMHWRDLAA